MIQFLMPRVYTVEELGELSKASSDRFVSDRHRAEEELSSHYHDCFEKSYTTTSPAHSLRQTTCLPLRARASRF